jgi:hypothetical protein
LKSRTRNLTDFHIRADEPHRQYSPGDVVTGAVVLTIVKPVRITHITVRLHGTVRVFKNPNDANEPVVVDAELAAAGDPRKTQYFGNGHASLFNDEVTLCGEGRLETGIYEFKFELEFPRKGLPTSIDVGHSQDSWLNECIADAIKVREGYDILFNYSYGDASDVYRCDVELRSENQPCRDR